MRRKFVALFAASVMAFSAFTPAAMAQSLPRTEYSYPDSWRSNFMAACTVGGAPAETCACVLRGFEFSWPFWVAEEFDRASGTPPAEHTPEQVALTQAATRIIYSCAANQNAY